MRRLITLTITMLALTSFMAITVWAQNAHFVGKVTANFVDGNVQVCWKEAGVGNNTLISYLATADATATFVCVNGGGECPNAANKTTVSGPVSATGTFSSGNNGQITQCLTLVTPTPAPGGFACPSGQTLTLSQVTFSNITLTDTTNGISPTVTPSMLSAITFVCPKK